MTPIKINNSITLDLNKLIESKLLIQANSGGGKSWLIRRLLEQSHGKVQQIVLDLEGEFGTLREKYDYIIAGKDGDTPVESRSAALLARRLLELKVSAIVDLYELPHHERKHFVRLFLEAMINAPKELWHPVLVVIDEAHVFAPEKGDSEAAEAVKDLASRGRKRGFGVVLATQRLSKLHKDAAAECNNKLIGRASQDIDMKRSAEELGFTSKEQMLSLRTVKPGEFYAFGPAISDDVQKITVGEVETSHPKAGARSLSAAVPPTEKIRKILGQLADLPKEAAQEAKTMDDLRTEIRTLRAHRCPKTVDPEMIEREVRKNVDLCEKFYKKELNTCHEAINKISGITGKFKTQPVFTQSQSIIPEDPVKPRIKTIKDTVPTFADQMEENISSPEQRVLDAIAWLESIKNNEPEKAAVALVAGYAPTSGGFANILGKLRAKDCIVYTFPGHVGLLAAGREQAEIPDQDITSEDLQYRVKQKLSGPEQKLLDALIASYPQPMSSDELAAATGYAPKSGGFANLKGRLRTFGLIDYPMPGKVKARDILFIE